VTVDNPIIAAMNSPVDRTEIERVHAAIAPYIRVTPIVDANGADFGLPPFALTFKLEELQHAGSFKTRGAFANLLLRHPPAAGVVAASGGNHGAAVAYAAMRLDTPARIFVPTVSSPAKIARIRSYGAELTVTGERYAEALAASIEWAEASGALQVHAFDQRETIAGQGTLGLELSKQAPQLDTILVAVGGGGLVGGLAAWYASNTRIIAVEPDGAPTLAAAMKAGRPVDAPAGSVAADSLAPRQVGALMFPLAQAHVERVVLVTDAAILEAQQAMWEGMRIVAEAGASAAFAALLSGAYRPAQGERVGVVVSGANTTAVDFAPRPA
jgi:threonine dehydratase